MKKILLISSLIFLFSCEKDKVLITSDEPSTSLIEEYIEHYFDIASDSYTQPDGEDYFLKPHRWKYGGFNGTEKIDVFFHESFNNINAKNNLISFFSVLDNIIEDDIINEQELVSHIEDITGTGCTLETADEATIEFADTNDNASTTSEITFNSEDDKTLSKKFKAMNMEKLREECKNNSLSTEGTKSTLIARIIDNIKKQK